MKIYELALVPACARHSRLRTNSIRMKPRRRRSAKKDEAKSAEAKRDTGERKKRSKSQRRRSPPTKKASPSSSTSTFTDLASRLSEVPAPPGNYSSLQATDKRLCWLDRDEEAAAEAGLTCLDIANKGDAARNRPSPRRERLTRSRSTARKCSSARATISSSSIPDVKAGALGDPEGACEGANRSVARGPSPTNPRAEFRELFLDAWRLERDYFYDRSMHGVDWPKIRDRYLPLVDRVADREELNDVIAQMVSELSALHIFVRGGDSRKPSDQVDTRLARRRSCVATKKPAASSWSTSTSTIPICPTKRRPSHAPTRSSRKAKSS